MLALKKKGLSIPNDIMVAGFDGTSQSAFTDPPLTTVQIRSEEIGRIMVLEKDKEHPDAALMGGFRGKVYMRVQAVILLCTMLSIASAAFH